LTLAELAYDVRINASVSNNAPIGEVDREERMNTRAIWQGNLKIRKLELPVKLYSAVQDRQVHFHLLHRRDRTRVQ
jgi:hypothetical protein